MKKVLIIVAITLILATGAWFFWFPEQAMDRQANVSAGPQMPPPAVAVLKTQLQTISLSHQLPGRISPYRQSQVRPQVDGIVTERLFEEGADVKKGQQLYQIDDARYRAALSSAKADLKSAQANVKTVEARSKRYEALVKIQAVSQQEYDDVNAQLDQANAEIAVAQAAVDLAQVNLGYTKVYAPISGRISRSLVTEGALVTANQSQHLATITQLDPVYIDMQLSGSEAVNIRNRLIQKTEPTAVHLLHSNTKEKELSREGTLKFSEVTVDQSTGSITLRALMPNEDSVLLPGLFVRATIDLGQEDVLLVPQRATTRTPDGSLTVWVVDENSNANPQTITVEQAYKDSWIVTGGLNAGTSIIVEGYQKLAPNTTVTIEPWQIKNGLPSGASNTQNNCDQG